MSRFVGIKDNRIRLVSNNQFTCVNMDTIQLDDQLNCISASDLILNYKIKDKQILPKRRATKDLKVAIVTNWKMKCGIATYAEFLYTELTQHLGDFKLFIEKQDNYLGDICQIGDRNLSKDRVTPCWKRGESLQDLIKQIKDYDPDVVLIQHEFGLWPNARYWLAFMSQLHRYRVIVTMHSVFHHKDKTICEAAIPEIITHLDGGKNVLKEEKQIPGKVYVIPHGCFPCLSRKKLWNFYKSDQTFMQFGFGFRYKNWTDSIKATAILKNKYPDVFFTGLFSESDFNKMDHQIYLNELMDLIDQLGIQNNVAIIRGYQSDVTLDSFLRTNQATVFPYGSHPEHEVYGASGAARFAMSKGIPVITSSIHHFSDLPTIKADTPQDIATSLDLLFSSDTEKENQVNKQIKYLNDNTWQQIALKHIEIIDNSI